MKQIKTYIYYPNGNTTAVVKKSVSRKLQPVIAQKIIEQNIAEQVVFLEKPSNKKAFARLQMMGNEFSGNAILVFGYFLIKNFNLKNKVFFESSGIKKLIKVSIKNSQVVSEIAMNLSLKNINRKRYYWTIPLPGIFQVIIPVDKNQNKKKFAEQLVKKYKDKSRALALIFVTRNKGLKINPFIWVKETQTLINETACGSGSIATALWWFIKNKKQVNDLPIIQPNNKKIFVSLEIQDNKVRKVFLKSRVKYLGAKTITLN